MKGIGPVGVAEPAPGGAPPAVPAGGGTTTVELVKIGGALGPPGPCDGEDGTPVPTGTEITGTDTDTPGAVPMGTEAETTGFEVKRMGTEAETISLDENTTGTLVSADGTTSGVVAGLCITNQPSWTGELRVRSWGYQEEQYTTGLVMTGLVTVHGQSVITNVVA